MCCLLLLVAARSPSGSSSAFRVSAPLSSAVPRPGLVAPGSCGGSVPPAVGGSSRPAAWPALLACFASAGLFPGSACVGSLAVRALSPCWLPVLVASGRRSCRRCPCPARCRRRLSSVRSCLRRARSTRRFFFCGGWAGPFLGGRARCVPPCGRVDGRIFFKKNLSIVRFFILYERPRRAHAQHI